MPTAAIIPPAKVFPAIPLNILPDAIPLLTIYWPAMTALTPPAMPPAPRPAVLAPMLPPVTELNDGKLAVCYT